MSSESCNWWKIWISVFANINEQILFTNTWKVTGRRHVCEQRKDRVRKQSCTLQSPELGQLVRNLQVVCSNGCFGSCSHHWSPEFPFAHPTDYSPPGRLTAAILALGNILSPHEQLTSVITLQTSLLPLAPLQCSLLRAMSTLNL